MGLRFLLPHRRGAVAGLVLLVLLLGAASAAGAAALTYQVPPQPLVDLVDAPPTPAASLSPDGGWLLVLERPSLPSIAELSEPEFRLAGLRFKPATNGPSRDYSFNGLALVKVADGSRRPVTGLPANPRIGDVSWSPDGSRLAFTVTGDDAITLWTAEPAAAKAIPVKTPGLNAVLGRPYRWLADSRSFVCALVPAGRGPEPAGSRVPAGPVVQENLGKTAPARTYEDLLRNPHDEDVFAYYGTSELARVTLDGKTTPLHAEGIISDFDPSPDGAYLYVDTIHRPFSYLVPYYRFPERVDVLAAGGKLVRTVADLPLREEVPIGFGAVPTGPRSFEWRADAGATLVWVEARDGGDPRAEAPVRDEVLTLAAPFAGDPRPLAALALRYGGTEWGTDDLALVGEYWWKTRQSRTWRVRPGAPETDPELLFDRNLEDRYGDPGSPLTRAGAFGRDVLRTSPGHAALFLAGAGASEEGDRPFLDRYDLASKTATRLWRSEAPYYESAVDLLDDDAAVVLTRRESPAEPPNYYAHTVTGGALRKLTDFPDPTPQLKGVTKELIRYPRADGVMLSGTLYLPAGYDSAQGPLPMVMWAYPQEFKSAGAAAQVTDSPYRFNRVSWASALLWLTRGYAVLDDPSLPIIGEGDAEPNDTYVGQLVAGARAAVDEVVRRGVADRDRIAIGGHSYGAFMTANLLAHSDLFRAGIARSGAYNRTLTPFGFQAEERTLWQAPAVYIAMSPFMSADRIDEPLLLIHGEADNNSGTFPMQSERLYNAVKGLGGTVRLVMLPYEAHGYRARESVLHMLWESDRWLDTYVKNAAPRERGSGGGGSER